MPKILEQPKEKMIMVARGILLQEGYKALTIRRIADACSTAAGTVYNYFPSKEHLAAEVMLADWRGMVGCMRSDISSLQGIEALQVLFDMIRRFSNDYRSVWDQCPGIHLHDSYHRMLVDEVSSYVREMHREPNDGFLSEFIAENILRYGSDGRTSFDSLREIFLVLMERGVD